jgi:citrate lyase beta subunit
MGHTAAAAAAAAEPALGLTKPNAIEPPQVRVIARAFLPLVPV